MVPFDNKKKGCKEAQFQLGYKGYIQLAKRSGVYKKINVLSIKAGELISYNPLEEELEINLIEDDYVRENTPTIGYYAMFEEVNGYRHSIYWSKQRMLAHAEKYSFAFYKNGGAKSLELLEEGKIPEKDMWKYSSFWFKDFDAMAHKTMLRQLISKWGTMSIDLQNAIDKDMAVIHEDGKTDYVDAAKAEDDSGLVDERNREELMRADAIVNEFQFDRYYDQERFLIELQANFIESDDLTVLKQVAGNIESGTTANYDDDGVSQKTTIKSGIANKTDVIVPNGDTCAFCIALASRGWQYKSKKAMRNGHAEHIHAHCDCEYAVRFDGKSTVAGYDPDKYLEEYYDANGDINEMRRKRYVQNKDVINARKRELYASKKAEKLEKLRRSDILISGARITDLNSAEADEFAEMYYEEIRHFSTDSKKIADNLGKEESDIRKIKAYLFEDDSLIDPDTGESRQFDPDCAIAQSWQRLMNGKDIKLHDKTLIEHELLEMKIKQENPGIDHVKAHELASEKYNYPKEALEYYGNLKKHKKSQ